VLVVHPHHARRFAELFDLEAVANTLPYLFTIAWINVE
jgi:hypothetical protein